MSTYTKIYQTLIKTYAYNQVPFITKAYVKALSGDSRDLMLYKLLYDAFYV